MKYTKQHTEGKIEGEGSERVLVNLKKKKHNNLTFKNKINHEISKLK